MLVFRYIDPEILALILVEEAERYAAMREQSREKPVQYVRSGTGDFSFHELTLSKALGQPLH